MGELAAVAGGDVASLIGQQMANQSNQQIAGNQMAFQQQMSNTAYQRSTADMKAAGLNPAMMFGSGGAESTPSGAAIPNQNVAAGMGNLGSQVMQADQMKLNSAGNKADVALKASQKTNIDSTTPAEVESRYAQASASKSSAKLADTQSKLNEAALQKAKAASRLWKGVNDTLDTGMNSARSMGEMAKKGFNMVTPDGMIP